MLPTRELKADETGKKIITASVLTDAGCLRESNEDRAQHVCPKDPETLRRRGTLTIVADGMGGHAAGEIASQMAIEIISGFYFDDNIADACAALRKAFDEANRQIYEAARNNEKFIGMGTTIVALVLLDDAGFAAHVGDSRLYRRRKENLQLLTVDHSQVMEMVKQGVLSIAEARRHEDKNVILRAVGTQPAVEIEMSGFFEVKPDDEFLLCSDGLTDLVDDEQILQTWLSAAEDINLAAEMLVNQARENGGHDNISVGIVKVSLAETNRRRAAPPVTREFSVSR
jgi:serine/threonine protein phosphatase PrpC